MATEEAARRIDWIQFAVRRQLHRSCAVVQLSGGIDSATVLHLAVAALGPENVHAYYLPDGASSPDSRNYAQLAAESVGCPLSVSDITTIVESSQVGMGITDLIKRYFTAFDATEHGYSLNFNPQESLRLGVPVYILSIGLRNGEPVESATLKSEDIRTIVASQNVKQRIRMSIAYRQAEQLHGAVLGCSNRDEIALGFVVKHGDDAADIYPIADLDKDSVVTLGSGIGVPREIINRIPTTDTYSLEQPQTSYYYGFDRALMNELVNAKNSYDVAAIIERYGYGKDTVAAFSGLTNAWKRTAMYNHSRLTYPYPGKSHEKD
ncbi:NAD(+) synthase [Nocardia colli]|uniref:NH(3)-dependent NAD(+) synthetase n=1 Tax=Nocardia colli TaxID=2545717 RepID=A0A5N0EFJ3_9NOCA|nr:NAD(+) synthase [Nocardia colli]KAA8887716.1 NAD(+) synthase [Nocardia colli]